MDELKILKDRLRTPAAGATRWRLASGSLRVNPQALCFSLPDDEGWVYSIPVPADGPIRVRTGSDTFTLEGEGTVVALPDGVHPLRLETGDARLVPPGTTSLQIDGTGVAGLLTIDRRRHALTLSNGTSQARRCRLSADVPWLELPHEVTVPARTSANARVALCDPGGQDARITATWDTGESSTVPVTVERSPLSQQVTCTVQPSSVEAGQTVEVVLRGQGDVYVQVDLVPVRSYDVTVAGETRLAVQVDAASLPRQAAGRFRVVAVSTRSPANRRMQVQYVSWRQTALCRSLPAIILAGPELVPLGLYRTDGVPPAPSAQVDDGLRDLVEVRGDGAQWFVQAVSFPPVDTLGWITLQDGALCTSLPVTVRGVANA